MKKLLFTALLLVSCGIAHADMLDFKVPLDVRNVPDPTRKSAGVDNCHIITSTTPVLAVDNSSTTITNGFLHWIVVPTTGTVVTSFLEVRSTNTANITSTKLLPRIFPLGNGAAIQASQVMTFDPPIPFSGGLSLNVAPAGSAPATGFEFSVGVSWKGQ